MKKVVYHIGILFHLLIVAPAFSQAPQQMSYQAVIRNSTNALVSNTAVGMRVSILQGSVDGTEVFREIYNPNPITNANGLVTIQIGGGILVKGSFASINWANGPYFIKVETDPSGGTNYTITGISQLLSVPYALYAATAGKSEYQQLSIRNDTIFLSNGGFVKLPGSASGATLQDRIISSKVLSGVIDENVELPKGKYILKGYVYVNNRANLRFAPGSVIVGDTIQKGALIIEQNAKIFAEGTATEPIVFTSGKAPGQRRPGDWGGIALAGNAPTNRTTAPILEGGINTIYGGPLANDNSGILKYVRIEFAGIAADPNSEINGLTLGGVGRGTIIENVQVSYGNDDAFEFFGGTVNCKNLIAFATADDDFDFDFGYVGSIQFGVSLRDPQFIDGGDAGNGIECDNDGAGTTATPRTRPVLSNFTFCGPNGASGTLSNHNFNTRFRRSTQFVLINSILMGYQKAGFQFESDATAQSYIDGSSLFRNNLVHAVVDPYRVNSTTLITANDVKSKAESEGSITYASANDIQLENPFNLIAPNFLPKAGSPALGRASFAGFSGLTNVTYVGAFGTANWTVGWTSFTPQTNIY